MDFAEMNRTVIAGFRETGGKGTGPLEGAQLVLLNVKGAKTGRDLVTPLVYTKDGDDLVVIASKAGAPKNPAWYHNLVANPGLVIEVGSQTYEATAVLVEDETERKRLYDAQAAAMPQFNDYEKSAAEAGRVIPVFRLVKN